MSNSQRRRVDRFRMEKDTLEQFCHFTRREAMIIHQKDPILARALIEAGYSDVIGEDDCIRDGKAEGMVAAMFLAMLAKKDYIGFIDADNYFPGAVWEYVRCYAAGFSMANSPYAMVRVLWRYKPKLSAGIYFKKWGRASEITNKSLNSLISVKTGFETDIIKTGNAGEHAMSLKLAEILPYASGYAIEPQELISIFEGFSGALSMAHQSAAKNGVEIFQIETRNPHLHEDKGGKHVVEDMLLPGLGAIYHSLLCEEETKQLIINELLQQKVIEPKEEPPIPHINSPPKTCNLKKFAEIIEEHLPSYSVLEVNE
jgi:mannosyl-3-phosphoglycerate synthase